MSEVFKCPSCGTALSERINPITLAHHLPVSGMQRVVLDMLVASFARDVPTSLLVDRMYSGVKDGGPETAYGRLKVCTHGLRKLLEPYGLTIIGRSGKPPSARLDWLDAPALTPRRRTA